MTPMEIQALAPQLTEADIAAILHAKAGGRINDVAIRHVGLHAYDFGISITISVDTHTHGLGNTFAEALTDLSYKTTSNAARAAELRAHAEKLLEEANQISSANQ